MADRALAYVSTIARLVGVPFLPVTDEDPFDYTTYFQFVTPDPEGAKNGAFVDWISRAGVSPMYDRAVALLDGNQCSGITEENLLGYGTTRMVAMIPTGDQVTPQIVARCVIEETLQGFGLPFDIGSGVQTLFDDRGNNIRITAFDLFMFSILYHPSIEPGMTADDVRAVFDEAYDVVWARFAADPWWAMGVDPS